MNECNQAKKFFREDHFRQHLKHSHAATIGEWINLLAKACKKDEPPPQDPLPGSSSTAAQHDVTPSTSTSTNPDSPLQTHMASPLSGQNITDSYKWKLLRRRPILEARGEPKGEGKGPRSRVSERVDENQVVTSTRLATVWDSCRENSLELWDRKEEPEGSKVKDDKEQEGRKDSNKLPLHRGSVPSNSIPRSVSTARVAEVTLEPEQLQEISQCRISTMLPQAGTPVDKKDDNSFNDSGYASVSRVSKSITQSISGQRRTTLQNIQLLEGGGDDEIQSIDSDESHIGSDASVQTSAAQHEGKAYFARFLADDKDLRTLLEQLLQKMGIGRFSNTMRKLLKVYYKSLSKTANTERKRLSVSLLKSRRGRRRIGELIAGYLGKNGDNDDDDDEVDPATKARLTELRMSLLEEWLGKIPKTLVGEGDSQGPGSKSHLKHHEANNRSQGLQMDDSDIDSESDDDDEHIALSYLTEMQTFFHDSVAFGELVQNLPVLLLPHALAQIVFSTRKDSIYLSQEADLSLINKWKGQVEQFTQVEWDWWPLSPHIRDLQLTESRLHWTCVSLTKLKASKLTKG
ncbi:uncharacterized protein N0V89_010169 [Didymosphaeria variabile]|uniref:C2H2-type domain-containing protein n=1 Tax=Didymosphaeria variabile TaxID=1932322 RepID=A0A9W9C820_9PLEO|nr:uncharacterized protein N0V89_010169 [Didymosphaeria variabile]KAJ4348791.1 hypothetical protein N0V89_010169 [Didymosphaeria variabile]